MTTHYCHESARDLFLSSYSPEIVFVCQSEQEKQENKCDGDVDACLFWSDAYRLAFCFGPDMCVSIPHTDVALCVNTPRVSVPGHVYLTDCVYVCTKGMCVWKAVPEGSRQSKGVNSLSMERIYRSLISISWLIWNWEQDTHCCFILNFFSRQLDLIWTRSDFLIDYLTVAILFHTTHQ